MSYGQPSWGAGLIVSLVFSGLALATFAACFIASWFCKWPKASGTGSDKLRLFALPAALLAYILWGCLNIAALLVGQLVDFPSRQFQIIYIFEALGTWTAEILLALIIQMILFRRPDQQSTRDGFTTAVRYVTLGLIFVAFALGAAVVGTHAESTALYIEFTGAYYAVAPDYIYWGFVNEKLFVAYSAILLAALAILFAYLVSKLWKTIPKAEAVPTLVAILAFFVQKLDDCITTGHFVAEQNNVTLNIAEDEGYSYSNIIIYNITAMVLIICLVIVGIWNRKQMRAGGNPPFPNYVNPNSGGYNYNAQMVQQPPPQQYTQQYAYHQHGPHQPAPQQQYYQPPNFQPQPPYQYPQPAPVSGQSGATGANSSELSSGNESPQFAKLPGSPQMLHSPTPQPYRA